MPDLEKALAAAEGELAKKRAAIEQAEEGVRKVREELQSLDKSGAAEAEKVRKLLADQAHLEGRIRGVEATVAAHEGLNEGARSVLDAASKKQLPGRYVPVGEALEVAKEHAVAIETALGASANDLIVEDEAQAREAIEMLKESGRGRAVFQVLSLIPKSESPKGIGALLQRKGVVARALDLVKCDPNCRPVAESLLAGTLVVESLDVALGLSRQTSWTRIVTLEGEVLDRKGSLSGGRRLKQAYGAVQRKADLAELRQRLAESKESLKALEAEERKREKAREKIEEKLSRAHEAVEQRKAESEESREWLKSLNGELNDATKSREKLLHEEARLKAARPAAVESVDLSKLESERDALLKQLAARSADAERADEALREAERRLEQAELRLKQAERRLEAVQDSDRSRQRKQEGLEPERKRASGEIEAARKQRDASAKERDEVGAHLRADQERRRQTLERSLELSDRIKASRLDAQRAVEQVHQTDLARARADARRAASAQRLLEEYGVTEEEAVKRDPEIEVPKDAGALTSRLRRELREMGDVNVGAIEAFERLSTRHDELSEQREDILKGIEELEAGVRELDGMTRERFKTTFESVQQAFSEVFLSLFPGGKGEVRLTDASNLLASGVEIDVTLPGKKRQKLELLSGGERSLCATAFLFALLKVKPSPLVVLDEVDAPLDGRNVERFVELLKGFSDSTQFIVITHNQTTIASSPVWIGVTMQEPGVSTLVPVRMPNGKSNGHARAVVQAETSPVNA
jgi:chromosome segregation protein